MIIGIKNMAETITCVRCKGSGFVSSYPYSALCDDCRGRGWSGWKPDPNLDLLNAVWGILDETDGSEGFVYDLVNNSIRSWKGKEKPSENLEHPDS